jgi:hypothetical protein
MLMKTAAGPGKRSASARGRPQMLAMISCAMRVASAHSCSLHTTDSASLDYLRIFQQEPPSKAAQEGHFYRNP